MQRVHAHLGELGIGQLAGFVENRVGHADLADVVQQSRQLDDGAAVGVEPELLRQPHAERRDALGVLVRVAVLGVDDRRDRLHDVEEQALDFGHQPRAVHRDAGLVPDGGQQLQFGFAEFLGFQAVDVEHAQNGLGRAHRRAHHRPDLLPHDAFAADVALVGQRVIGEGGNALLDDVVHDRARQHHLARALAFVARAHGDQVDFVAGRAGRAHQDGGAVAAAHLQDGRQNRIKQRFDRACPRQDVRHLVQRGQVFLRGDQQLVFVLALVDLRQELELGRVDGALHEGVAARFDEAERRRAVEAGDRPRYRRPASRSPWSRCGSCRVLASSFVAIRRSLRKVPLADCRSVTTHPSSRAVMVQWRRDAASSSTTTSQPLSRPSVMVCPVETAMVRPTSLPARTTNSKRIAR